MNFDVFPGEECDCGFDDQECQEECCYPRQSKLLSPEENKAKRLENYYNLVVILKISPFEI